MPKKAKATKPATKTPSQARSAQRCQDRSHQGSPESQSEENGQRDRRAVKEQGFETSANYVATIKTKMKGKKKAKAAPAPTPEAAAPALPKDAISLAWLEKAKCWRNSWVG